MIWKDNQFNNNYNKEDLNKKTDQECELISKCMIKNVDPTRIEE